ncbi:hypothetical protein ACEPAI_2312 [Sanghuangporus weigelae]
MGRLKPPSPCQPYAGNMRRRNDASGSSPPARERSSTARATSPMQDSQSMKKVIAEDQSDFRSTTRSSHATVSPDPTAYRDSQVQTHEIMHACSHPPSTPPGVYTPIVQSPTRSIIAHLRGRASQHAVQDGYPSILECLKAHLGNAPASQLYKGNTTSDSPISAAVRQIQECGRPARAEALQTVGILLKLIDQQKVNKEEVNVFFRLCVDIFARLCMQDPFDNIMKISFVFEFLSVLIQEGMIQGSDFIRAAITLCEESHYDGCRLLIQLALEDGKIKLAGDELAILTDIVSELNTDQNKGKQKAA